MTGVGGRPWNPATDPKPAWLQRLAQTEMAAATGDEPFAEDEDESDEQCRDYARQDEAWALKREGHTASAIAAQMRTTRNAVIGLWKRYRDRHGIAPDAKRLGPQPLPMDRTLMRLYEKGLTLQEIADRTGYGTASGVKQRLDRLGVDKRSRA
jgi:hypothetical protein